MRTLFLKDSALDEKERLEDGALLKDGLGVRGHGAWCDSTDVSVVTTTGDKEDRATVPLPEHLEQVYSITGSRYTVSQVAGIQYHR